MSQDDGLRKISQLLLSVLSPEQLARIANETQVIQQDSTSSTNAPPSVTLPPFVQEEDSKETSKSATEVSSDLSALIQTDDPAASQPSTSTTLDLPVWITLLGNKLHNGYYFEACAFDVKSNTSEQFHLWYATKLSTCNWPDFTKKVSELVADHAELLEEFFSCCKKPKPLPRRVMHSTERHHLAAMVAKEFPLLSSQYAQFKRQHSQGYLQATKMCKTTFRDQDFYHLYHSKLTRRLGTPQSNGTDDDAETTTIRLRKPNLSNKLKSNKKAKMSTGQD